MRSSTADAASASSSKSSENRARFTRAEGLSRGAQSFSVAVVGADGSGFAVGWQEDLHRRAFLNSAFDLKPPAVRLNDVFDDGESESGAAELARARFVDAVEAFGQPRQIFFRYPAA